MTLIWLPATLAAALLQAWRTAVQQRVRGTLSVNAAGLVRYLFGLPVGLVLLAAYVIWRGSALPAISLPFIGWALAAGLAQIIATNLLLMAFGYRNFVVGTAYAKTEAIQGAFLSLLLLGERLSALTWAGIAVGVIGVLTLSTAGARPRWRDLVQPAALCGLGAGLGFTLTSIGVRVATRDLGTDDMILAALVTLCVVQTGQTLMQGAFVAAREPAQWPLILASWRQSAQVGALAALGSACWFTGFATAPVALVRTVGQVEVLFTLGFARLYLKERVRRFEVVGLMLVGAGVALALAGAL